MSYQAISAFALYVLGSIGAGSDLVAHGPTSRIEAMPPLRAVASNSDGPSSRSPDYMPLSYVMVPGELPEGALAIVQLRPRGLERTFIILSETHVSDALAMRASAVATVYRMRHPNDKSNVEFWLFPGGRLETRSAGGVEVGSHIPVAQSVSGDESISKALFDAIARTAQADYPGFGPARVIVWR